MTYVLAPNQIVQVYPYSIDLLRRDFPNVSFPASPSLATLAAWNVFPVVEQTPPSYDPSSQTLVETNPELIDGEWSQAWQIIDTTSEQSAERNALKAEEVRNERNRRLTASDWTQLPDVISDKDGWAAYRQALRDVPEQEGFPWEVVWPQEP